MNIEKNIAKLMEYSLNSGLILPEDEIFTRNRLLDCLGLTEWNNTVADEGEMTIDEILDNINDYAAENGIITGTNESRDLFDTKVMGVFTAFPREVIRKFKADYAVSPRLATDNYFDWNKKTNYVRAGRIAKDMKWVYSSEYGNLDITINLSKPEKDPRDIAAAKNAKSAAYPKCQLCFENTGYAGRIGHPARQNLIPVPMTVHNEDWCFQYSPYGYYNEHCIIFNSKHIPMKIDDAVFGKLFDIIETLPHYFVGSNADLPIVGGSILSHEHFQGGNYTFAMETAPVEYEFTLAQFPEVKAGIVKWPMSVIRLNSADREQLEKACAHILRAWRAYSDESVGIYSHSADTPHNTITPIARKKNNGFECDLVLRNNRTDDEHPLGIFHPNSTLHHIKKENIGLIEVMGLAVLPARLKSEMELLADTLVNKGVSSVRDNEVLEKHADWVEEFAARNEITAYNVNEIIQKEIGAVFAQVLEDAGVFKRDEAGIAAFRKFAVCL
ncbi:MAG: UDP-glucose--hexose-1-phosphate uridylyltransferase [Ruminiclostridium sp.]|nr:UDP-glucose--hexose-1-phosphate uridylyltransferase [Ruminiclostridium sp.]